MATRGFQKDALQFKTLSKEMQHRDREMVPKTLVQAMFALMLSTVAIVAYAQLTGAPNVGVLQEAAVASERTVTLTGTRAGVYTVTDADGTVIARSSDDKAGFIGVMGLVLTRERTIRQVPLDAPVRIVRRVNDHVAIIDDSTGRVVELIGYGADNVAAFANMVKQETDGSGPATPNP